jgi:preprotein translocase subunit SecG
MYTVLTFLHVFICLFLIVVVLLQAGKGGGMGIAFGGGGGSQTVFGSSGAGNFLTRLTAIFAVAFFLNSLILAYMSSQSDSKRLQAISERRNVAKEAEKAKNDQITKDIEQRKSGQSGDATKIQLTPTTPAPATTPPAPAAPATDKPVPAPEGKASETKTEEKAAPAEAPAKPKRVRAPKPAAPKDEAPAAPSEPATPPATP